MKRAYIASLLLLICLSVRAENEFDSVQILESDKERIKATGDLQGKFKLMKVVVQFRDNDLLLSGNDYRYGYPFPPYRGQIATCRSVLWRCRNCRIRVQRANL